MKSSVGILISIIVVALTAACGREEKDEPAPAAAEAETVEVVAAKEAVIPPEETPKVPPAEEPAPARPELSDRDVERLIAEVEEGLRTDNLSRTEGGPNPVVLLGRSRSPEAVAVLGKVLSSSADPLARRQAARSLGMIPGEESLELLRAALDDEYIWVRLTAALGLARGGDGEAPLPVFAEIIQRRGSDDWKIEIAGPAVGERSEEERERIETNLARLKEQTFPLLALSGLAEIDTPAAQEIVRFAAENKNPYVRRKAEKILEGENTP